MELSREFSTNIGEREQVLLFLNAYEETSTQKDTDDVKDLNTLHRCILNSPDLKLSGFVDGNLLVWGWIL